MKYSRKTKIKLVEFLPSPNIGGAEKIVQILSESINKDIFDVTIVSHYDLPSDHWAKDFRVITLGKKKSGFDFKIIKKLSRAIKTLKPDIIHNHSLVTLIYLILANRFSLNTRIVQTIHNDLSFYLRPRLFWTAIFKYFKIKTVGLSNYLNKYPISTNYVVKNGIEINDFLKIKRPKFQKRILFLGRLDSQKDPLKALEVFKILEENNCNFKLNIAGSGKLGYEVLKSIKKIGGKSISFTNKMVVTENFFKKNDIFLLTSRYEGLPLIVMEAMAAGLVVVATPVKAIKDLIVSGYDGYIADNFTASSIAKTIMTTCFDIKKINKISNSARRSSKRFSKSIMIKKYEKIFKIIFREQE